MSFSLEKIKEFEKEIERRQGIDREAKEAERKQKEANKEKEEKKKRHAKWRKKGIVYYRAMLKKEKGEEEMKILEEKRLAEEKAAKFQSHIYSW